MEYITVFVGCDTEGDNCLYLHRDGEYLGAEELEEIACDLQERLNQEGKG
jgi:hypothetical protein